MNDHLKQRLVGAVVLVALAVIFVPMLLQGHKRSGIPMFGSNVPSKPDLKAGEIDIPLQVPSPAPAAAATAIEQVAKPAPAARPAPKAAAPAAVPAVPSAPAQTLKPAVPVSTTPPAEAWAVQVGSFGEVHNAMKLRDSLRAKGYPAYVEQIRVSHGASYRVRVGPMLARGEAVTLQGKLEAKLHMRGIVVNQP